MSRHREAVRHKPQSCTVALPPKRAEARGTRKYPDNRYQYRLEFRQVRACSLLVQPLVSRFSLEEVLSDLPPLASVQPPVEGVPVMTVHNRLAPDPA